MDLEELKKWMKGVSVVQITPFNTDGSVDLEGLRTNTRWLAEKAVGKDFIFTPVGSTGEFYAMSEEECKAVIKAVVEETEGRAVVMAGAARAGTRETIKMCQYAQSAGADGAQVILPYYHIPEEEGMYLHYKKLAESVDQDFGIMIYNNPAVSGSWINPALMRRLSKIPNIIAVKENGPFILSYYAMRREVDPDDMAILCGLGEIMFSFQALYGSPGVVSSTANFAPDLSHSIYEAGAAHNFDVLTKRVRRIEPFFNLRRKMEENHGPHTGFGGSGGATAGNMYISVVKTAMNILGLCGGKVRLPLIELTEKEKKEVGDTLKTMELL